MLALRLNRKRLFSMMNDLPTVFEVVTGRKPVKDKPTVESGSKSRNSTKVNFSRLPCTRMFLMMLNQPLEGKGKKKTLL